MTLSLLGEVYAESNDHVSAVDVFRQAVEIAPTIAHRRYNLETALISIGDGVAAEAEIAACLALDSIFWKGHLALAHIRQQSLQCNHLQRLKSLLTAHAADHITTIFLNMALAKQFEDVAMHAESFQQLVLGKAASRQDIRYSIKQDEVLFAAIHRTLPATGNVVDGNQSRELIFIFGLLHSGATVVDRILPSHPEVHSIGKSQNFGIALRDSRGTNTPLWIDADIINRARRVDWRKVGSTYVTNTRPSNNEGKRLIDKLPHNFLYAKFIANALPIAKMIYLKRDPADTCFSNFRQLFTKKLPYYRYSFDLLDTVK